MRSKQCTFFEFYESQERSRQLLRLYTLCSSGMPLISALRILSQRGGGDSFAFLLRRAMVFSDSGVEISAAFYGVALESDDVYFCEFSRAIKLCLKYGNGVEEALTKLRKAWLDRSNQKLGEHVQKIPIKLLAPLAACFLPLFLILFSWKGLVDLVATILK